VSFHKLINFGKKQFVSLNHPVFFIAEIGVNHEGNFHRCLRLIKLAKKAGANAVKIQLANAERNFKKNSKNFKIYKNTEFKNKDIKKIFQYAKKLKIILFATCDEYYFSLTKELNQELYKISSSQAQDLQMIKKINDLDKPMIISTGMNDSEEIIQIIKFLKKLSNKKIIMLHCVSKYPTKPNETNLSMINFLKNKFCGIVGYSDHTLGIDVCIYAAIYGAKVIEKHFTFDQKREGFDHKISINFKNFSSMVNKIRLIEKIQGSIKNNDEIKNHITIKKLRRSFFLNKEIKMGKKLEINDIYTKRIGIKSSLTELLKLIGKKTNKNLNKDTRIQRKYFYHK
jgi:N,N'-diacetyllegionaminate synthase